MTRKGRNSEEDILKKLQFAPSKKTREASFSSMRKGMKEMKDKGDPKAESIQNRRVWNARVAMIAAAAIFFLLVINIDFIPMTGENNENAEQEESVNHAATEINENNEKNENAIDNESDRNDSEENQSDEGNHDSPVERDEMKSITTYPEGGERIRAYQLLHEEGLPFTTYVREEWQVTTEEADEPFLVHLTPQDEEFDFGQMILRVSEDSGQKEKLFEEMIEKLSQYEEVESYESEEGTPFHEWLIEGYRFVDYGEDTTGYSYLFEAEDYIFWLHSEHRLEFQEGWFDDDIFSREWEWN
ncbi:hypothetical protein [Salisediminibacterium beveridgei]|uniref:ABC transporter related n=1 Tax=Salisediminibacterium beveridgei TaxID=632773 RepID=A0A1D7QWG6_9BACI|nr:hypothetical protein [Salisediminibacterium beveridgei]AOM83350.1 ABC transporter related [Salisediminibacterium beveridgei]